MIMRKNNEGNGGSSLKTCPFCTTRMKDAIKECPGCGARRRRDIRGFISGLAFLMTAANVWLMEAPFFAALIAMLGIYALSTLRKFVWLKPKEPPA